MERKKSIQKDVLVFAGPFLLIVLILIFSIIKTNMYNAHQHSMSFLGMMLFDERNAAENIASVYAGVRDSTWSKILDLDHEGLNEPNFDAYTVDFYVNNKTKDDVRAFSFRITFHDDTFLKSAWNGSLEIHQNTGSKEIVDTIPDLREFNPSKHVLETFTADGEDLVWMKPGDYLIYKPSTSASAMEVPIEPNAATVPGIIMYISNNDYIEDVMSLDFNYAFQRRLSRDSFFWTAIVLFGIWLVSLVIHVSTSLQIRKYQDRHERDNEIINESMETFVGFIDAKDPYTNGHSVRVARYAKLLAEELGIKGEELERIYYVALLHDCGKIGVPDKILGKPDKLTTDEFEVIKSHTIRGGEIMKSFKSIQEAGEGAMYHHERYDGTGYPEGTAGEAIPLIARIICVADSFDAMNTDRVYRGKLTRERIIEELETCKGTQFDPKIADIMVSLIKTGRVNCAED
ncbi:MAG: HD-GYP domain-containing protein [Lachnospiraceae bacterium]|nr:HD-GYP domain-containing protein [Lachnospiraceae bacterium]